MLIVSKNVLLLSDLNNSDDFLNIKSIFFIIFYTENDFHFGFLVFAIIFFFQFFVCFNFL